MTVETTFSKFFDRCAICDWVKLSAQPYSEALNVVCVCETCIVARGPAGVMPAVEGALIARGVTKDVTKDVILRVLHRAPRL